ncbi:serine hydroxymethyltransferase [Candidatus Woesearchaeota archaeon]|nr:serine hydroxymethyltransferase [Candidatus Woesearchaeota archaeon]
MNDIENSDPEIAQALKDELKRQEEGLEMIPSENNVSHATLQAMGSVLTNKYSEGYPRKRYYGGQEFADKIEEIAIDRAKKVFNVVHANVQPYSGSPANFAVLNALLEPGDCHMGLKLTDGGHLTHGWKVSATAKYFKSVPYSVKKDGRVDLEEVRRLAIENKPKAIWVGYTAYPRKFEFKEFAEIADEVGAYLIADIAHISGLVAGGAHESPVPYVHVITTTTHKTIRGPRGGMIMVTQKGIDKDPDLASKIDKSIFPGLQGGPHDHTTAGIAVALGEAMKPEFKDYAKQIVANAKSLAESLKKEGMKLVTDGTDTHLLLIDLTENGAGKGQYMQQALDLAGITVNKNTIPFEPFSAFYPSGIRLGTPSLTTRGMKEKDMEKVAKWIAAVYDEIRTYDMPNDKDERKEAIKKFSSEIKENTNLRKIREEVREFAKEFPLYPGFEIMR